MNKTETLKDGVKVLIRKPGMEDVDVILKFFKTLPVEDRKYLQIDVTNRASVERRLKRAVDGIAPRIVAVLDGDIVAYGLLEISEDESRNHLGELRVLVAMPMKRKGLGLIMMRELYFLAAQKKIKKIIAKIMRPQMAARSVCHKLGFERESLIPDYVLDRDGKLQDLIVMSCNMTDIWHELETLYMDSDWQRCR
jgi:L-amino acid N-acyltransferase YncA